MPEWINGWWYALKEAQRQQIYPAIAQWILDYIHEYFGSASSQTKYALD